MPPTDWWKTAVFYQIYPRSFADGNGDGVGDLAGMIARLDYLRDLGVDALWLSPHYPSPQFDCGYDVANYTGVADEYGTLADFQRFLDGAHDRGMRVILDLVLNHTSHLHPWFQASAAGHDNPYADWYIWHPGRDGGPPNNWLSLFGGPAWEWVPERGEYYYHFFFKQQPDLNWRNPAVRQAIYDVMRFWYARGVDGFRLDAIGTLFEDPALPDQRSSVTPERLLHWTDGPMSAEDMLALDVAYRDLFAYQGGQPGIHDIMRELRAVNDEFPGRMLIGETDEVAYYGQADDELHMVFNFPLMRTPRLTPAWVRANRADWVASLPPGAWPANTLGNHDNARLFNRYGDGAHDAALARLSLALVLLVPGTPFLYNGEEIGMTDLALPALEQMKDLTAHWRYHVERDYYPASPAMALEAAVAHGRDKCRTPLQWANAPNGGFSPVGVTPWLPVNPNYAAGVNVADQEADPGSLLNFYRQLLRVRRATHALQSGLLEWLPPEAEDYLAWVRRGEAEDALVVLNFSAQPIVAALGPQAAQARTRFGSGAVAPDGTLGLEPFGIYIGALARSV